MRVLNEIQMKNITIIGAGNVGTAMLAMLAQRSELLVTVYSTRKHLWNSEVNFRGIDSQGDWNAVTGFRVTDDLKSAVKSADQIFVTLPSFMREQFIKQASDWITPGTWIIFVPGCGGVEFFCKKLIEKKCRVFGFDRVPAVSRLWEYGKNVEFEWKKKLQIAEIGQGGSHIDDVCKQLSDELSLDFIAIPNYLSITLTPANPIMHPVRLYSMFKDKTKDSIIDHNILFYGEWDNESSRCLFQCDDELQELCRAIGLKNIVFLREHYQSYTPESMTQKMHSIVSFKRVQSPLKENSKGELKIDFQSRYFVEDFPFGLFIIKGLADICNVKTPMMDRIIDWYCGIIEIPDAYYSIPYKNGIRTIGDVHKLYNME